MSRTADLSDEVWARIEPSLPPLKGATGRPMRSHRTLIEGSIYLSRMAPAAPPPVSGLTVWRTLPPGQWGPNTLGENRQQVFLDHPNALVVT